MVRQLSGNLYNFTITLHLNTLLEVSLWTLKSISSISQWVWHQIQKAKVSPLSWECSLIVKQVEMNVTNLSKPTNSMNSALMVGKSLMWMLQISSQALIKNLSWATMDLWPLHLAQKESNGLFSLKLNQYAMNNSRLSPNCTLEILHSLVVREQIELLCQSTIALSATLDSLEVVLLHSVLQPSLLLLPSISDKRDHMLES